MSIASRIAIAGEAGEFGGGRRATRLHRCLPHLRFLPSQTSARGALVKSELKWRIADCDGQWRLAQRDNSSARQFALRVFSLQFSLLMFVCRREQYFRNWQIALHDVVTAFILAVIVLVVAVSCLRLLVHSHTYDSLALFVASHYL